MTTKGLIVVEQEEDTVSVSVPNPPQPNNDSARKSPIAELLYMRWLEGLKIKWPNILGS